MRDSKPSRRDVLKVSTALAAGVVFPAPLKAAGPTPTAVSQSMIEAAHKERTVAFYTAMEIPLAESLEKAFEAKYPGIDVRVKRSGAEHGMYATVLALLSPISYNTNLVRREDAPKSFAGSQVEGQNHQRPPGL